MRTYSRNVRRAWDGDDYHAPKRQRLDEPKHASLPTTNENILMEDNLERAIRETSVAAMSSSPSRRNSTVFSFNDPQEAHHRHHHQQLTPPSSPPPMLEITPPAMKARKPTFSTLEKKKQKEREKLKSAKRKREDDDARDGSEPLSEIMNSSRGSAHPPYSEFQPVQTPRPALSQPKALTQSVLDFGQSNTPITCGQCQMSYTPSVPEDLLMHDMYHNRHNKGIELGKPFMRSAMKWCYEVTHIPGSVVVVDRKISVPARRTVQKVLEVVNKELGSVDIPEAELWGQKTLEGESDDGKKVDNYKVFLHVIDGKCVAICLAERISKAFKVKSANVPAQVEDNKEKDSSKEDATPLTPTSSTTPQLLSSADLVLEEKTIPAVVGVSRIWTSKTFRKKGIANNLLDCVMTQFIYGLDIEKEEIAFSQPTDMGAALAKGWFGAESGWCVYREN